MATKFLDAVYHIKCNGLKKATLHKFYFEGVDFSSACRPVNKALGQPLITDNNGFIQFDFHFFDTTISDWEAILTAGGQSLAGTNIFAPKKLQVISGDGTSAAQSTITISATPVTTTTVARSRTPEVYNNQNSGN
jgi:hypothetical protein